MSKEPRKKVQPNTLILYLFILLLAGATSCSSTTSTDSSPDTDFPGSEAFDAELGEETTFISTHVAESALVESDKENHEYTFYADVLEDENKSLIPGEILILEGTALRKISSVNENDGIITVQTEFATINEAFKNADVDHTYEFDFNQTVSEKMMLEFRGELLSPNKRSMNGNLEWEYERGDFTIEGVLKTEERKADVELLVKYDTGDVSGAMKATATINDFQNKTGFRIENHETKSFNFNNPGLSGNIDLEFIFAGGVSDEQGWEPPMPALVFPFTVGPIPVVFRMGTVYVYKFDLGADGTAQFETSFSYSGDLGFQVEGSDFTPVVEGGIKNPAVEQAVGNAAGFGGSVSGQYGIAVPKISFNILAETVVPYLMQEYYIGASYTFPTCTELFSRYEVNAGVNMSVFGLADLNFDQNLVEIHPHKESSDGCEGNSKLINGWPDRIALSNILNRSDDQEFPFIVR